MGFYSKVILDSIAPCGKRLTTLEIRYPRFIHSEFMTHRMFCLDGDVKLTFALPSTNEKDIRPGIEMSLLDYVNAWNSNSTVEMSDIWNENRALFARDLRIFQLNEKTNEIQTAKVLRVYDSGTKEVREVTAGNYRVSGSKDHKILSSAGWKTIGELSTNDCLIVSVNNPIGSPYNKEKPYLYTPDDPQDLNKQKALFKKSQVQITSIKSLGNKSTYDLEINGEFPNFLANNVVVHNSTSSNTT